MLRKKIFTLSILLFLLFLVGGCSINLKTSKGGGSDGGVYVSANKGDTWKSAVFVPTVSGKPKNIGALNNSALAMDPNDKDAIYFGSVDNGLFYSYNQAKEWRVADKLNKATIKAIAVDQDSKCIIYAATGNKVYKSIDCNRTWEQSYYDNNLETRISAVVVDHYNSQNVYIGTSRGEIIKSSDRGANWKTIGRFDNEVQKIIVSPHDSRVIFVGTKSNWLWRSQDSGENWISLEEKLEIFKDSIKFRDIAMTKAEAKVVFLASNYGLLRSDDNGETWKQIELITPEKKAIINSIAVSAKDADEIYYTTNTTFYRSQDGGKTWATKKLPSSRAGWRLLIDPEDTNIIYMGVKKIED